MKYFEMSQCCHVLVYPQCRLITLKLSLHSKPFTCTNDLAFETCWFEMKVNLYCLYPHQFNRHQYVFSPKTFIYSPPAKIWNPYFFSVLFQKNLLSSSPTSSFSFMFLLSIKYLVGGEKLEKEELSINIFDVEWGEKFLI